MRIFHPFIWLLMLLPNLAFGQQFEVRPLPCNTRYNEFAPVSYNEGVVFCSDRPSRIAVTWVDADGNAPSKIYWSGNGGNDAANLLSENLVTRLNEGPGCFNPEGTEMIFTGTVRQLEDKGSLLGLFITRLQPDGWTVPVEFEHNPSEGSYSLAHPALSPDGNTLYFSSDMPGGQGGKDIYFCTKTTSGWSKPANLGPAVNTAANEIFPFISSDGKLYFTSAREAGTGLDVYLSFMQAGEWQPAQSMKPPINSEFDDFAFSMNPDGESGFFSSNRNRRNDDIYGFNYSYPVFEGCPPAEKPTFCYLFEELNIVPNDSMPLIYEWEFGDGTTAHGLTVEHCFEKFGDYSVGLNIYDSLTRAKFARVSELEVSIHKSDFPFIETTDSAEVATAVRFSAEGTDIDNFNIDHYFWDFGDGTRGKGFEVSHSYKEPGVYTVQLGLLSTPAEDGIENKRCATRQVTVGNPGVGSDGMPQPSVLHNDMIFTESDSIQTLKYAPDSTTYYVEFKQSETQIPLDDPYFENIKYEITERYNELDTIYRYSVGNTTEIAILHRIYRDLVDQGYNESIVREDKQDEFSNETTRKWWFMPDSLTSAINRHLNKFNDIRFRPNEYAIQNESFDNLEYIAQMMLQESGLNLRVMAHTDSTGSAEHNMKLSQQRAQAVVDFLITRGISKERLIPEGYGEQAPSASNADETGRALNRRVSFEIAMADPPGRKRQ